MDAEEDNDIWVLRFMRLPDGQLRCRAVNSRSGEARRVADPARLLELLAGPPDDRGGTVDALR